MTDLLSVERLSSWHGEAQVLWDIQFDVAAGDGLGIIGRNGAGKSTLLRTIAGVHRRASGTVTFRQEPALGRAPHHTARRGLSLVREGAPVFADLTVLENIRSGAQLASFRGMQALPLHKVWNAFPMLEGMQTRRAGLLSGGQRQMLALATALASQPVMLLLDEPSAGLAPSVAAAAFEAIGQLRQTGLCVLIAEQNPEWLSGVTSRVLELESGHMIGARVTE